MWPCQNRKVSGGDADGNVAVMEGVEHLGKYVFEMTNAKVKALKEGNGVLPPIALGGSDESDAEVEGEDLDDEPEEFDGVLEEVGQDADGDRAAGVKRKRIEE